MTSKTKHAGFRCAAFTHARYEHMLVDGKDAGFCFGSFDSLPDQSEHRPWCLLRHDCDNDLAAAVDMARLEHRHGVASTWFVMLRSPMYNILSEPFARRVKDILSMGHHLGLHFDESRLADEDVERWISTEREILSREFKVPVNTVSFHQPSRRVLDGTIKLECVNTYSAEDLPGFHYYSDSNMVLREGCPSVLLGERHYHKLQLLIHPEWWTPRECSMEEKWVRMVRNNVGIVELALRERETTYPNPMRLAVRGITDTST